MHDYSLTLAALLAIAIAGQIANGQLLVANASNPIANITSIITPAQAAATLRGRTRVDRTKACSVSHLLMPALCEGRITIFAIAAHA